MKLRKHLNLIIAMVVFLSCFLSTIPVSAEQYVVTHQYDFIPIPKPYTVDRVIMNIEGLDPQFDGITDIFLRNGKLFVVDSGNSRIVKIDTDGNLLAVFDGEYGELTSEEADEMLKEYNIAAAESEAEKNKILEQIDKINLRRIKKLNSPQGIYVDEDEDMFIADTANQRIVHLSPDGKFVEAFYQPEEDTYDRQYPFRPTKVYIDAVRRLYIINEYDYHGLISIDADNTFLGYLGASRVGVDLLYKFYKLFMTDEQASIIVRETPPYFTNFVINEHDSLTYCVQRDAVRNQIQVLTPAGENVYQEGRYGYIWRNTQTQEERHPMFNDIAVSKDGIIFASDATSQHIYIYDQEGNNLALFGEKGNSRGNFQNLSSLVVGPENELYVADYELNIIQVMKPTLFMSKVIEASALYTDGRYEEALEPWLEVLNMHSTYEMAVRGIAKAEFRRGNYKEAMKLSMIAEDKLGYSEPFYEYRLDMFRKYFNYILVGTIIFIIVLFNIIKLIGKKANKVNDRYDYSDDKFGISLFFDTMLLIIYHPLDCMEKIKANRDRYRLWHIAALVLLIIIVRVVYVYLVHFPMSNTLPQNTDFWQLNISFFLPLALWIVVSYALTSISDGKTTFKEAVVSTLYSFTPYIIFSLPLALSSRLMSTNELGLYTGLTIGLFLWCVWLVLLSTMRLNEYGFKQLVFTVIKTLFGAAVIIMLTGIFYVLISQFITFVREINREIIFLVR